MKKSLIERAGDSYRRINKNEQSLYILLEEFNKRYGSMPTYSEINRKNVMKMINSEKKITNKK